MPYDRLQQELSLDLDGRLSPARRAALYDVLKNDPKARATRAAMIDAREAARSSRRHRVSESFHESLMRRVAAGEGTPEASFRQPTPWTARLRDLGLGAAAAAATLIGVQLATDGSAPSESDPLRRSTEIATIHEAEAAPYDLALEAGRMDVEVLDDRAGSLRPMTPFAERFPVTTTARPGFDHPIANGTLVPTAANIAEPSPWVVADEAHTTFVSATENLRQALLAGEASDGSVLRSLTWSAQRARSAAQWLEWMSQESYVELPPDLAGSLQLVLSISDRLERAARTADRPSEVVRWEVQSAREQLSRLQTDTLRRGLSVRCCTNGDSFADRFVERMLRAPGPVPLHLVRVPQPTELGDLQLHQSGGQQLRVFVIRQR